MSQAPQQQKNRFQLSREVQESFVNSLAETMLSLAEQAGKVEQGWSPPSMGELPFCPVTGKEYSGANMVRLMLTGMEKGYADNRWMTFNQLQEIKDSHPDLNNPFTFGSAEALTQLLVSLMPASDGANSIFADKAQALISGVMYALVDLRDKGLLKLSTSIIRDSLALEKCVALALHPELDEESRASIQAALGTSGWIAGREMKDQPPSFAEQFGYAQSYFGKALSSLTDTYSHIYGAEDGEMDFADAIMQRRVLVVLLPSLEKAPAELASLGKISLSAIRNACAVGLGAHIEGDAADVLEALPTDTVGIGPYLCIVDEYAAIVTPGFEVVLTQGRGLGIAAIVASQDYAGILEADKKGAQQMVANTSIKIFMKMQDAEKTWELIRGQAGQSTVLRTTGFNVNEKISSEYRDANSTTVEQEDRVVLRDLQEQIEGEAHFVFSGQLVRGDMFFANPSLKRAQLRVPQLLQLSLEKSYENAA